MSEHDELTGLALVVAELVRTVREKDGQIMPRHTRNHPNLRLHLRAREVSWVATVSMHHRPDGSAKKLVAEAPSALDALKKLRLVLIDMATGNTGGVYYVLGDGPVDHVVSLHRSSKEQS